MAMKPRMDPQLFVHKKIVLVTGSATGLGANIAWDLAAAGDYFVVVTGRDESRMRLVVDECNRLGATDDACAISFRADLLDPKQVSELVNFIVETFCRLDVLINNACWRGDSGLDLISDDDQSYDDFAAVMSVNTLIPMFLIHKCLIPLRAKKLKEQAVTPDGLIANADDKSIIINISSIASHVVVPLHSYSISKACLSEMSRQLSEDELFKRLGIISLTISPGPILTDERPHHQEMSNLTLMRRVGSTQEVSNLVLFTIKHPEIFSGREITIDGGYVAKQRLSSKPRVQQRVSAGEDSV